MKTRNTMSDETTYPLLKPLFQGKAQQYRKHGRKHYSRTTTKCYPTEKLQCYFQNICVFFFFLFNCDCVRQIQ